MSDNRNMLSNSAYNGLVTGVAISCVIILNMLGLYSALAGLAGLAAMIAVPFVVYRLMARDYMRVEPEMRKFGTLWLDGISAFMLGSLILCAATYLMLRFAMPGYIYRLVGMAVEMYRSLDSPVATELANEFQELIDKKALPTPIQASVSIAWTAFMSGVMLTLLLAGIITMTKRNK